MRLLNSCLLLCLLGLAVAGQDGDNSFIEGTVKDSNGNPVVGAEVLVVSETYPDKTYSGLTNTRGVFSFSVPSGKARIRARRVEGAITEYSEYTEAVFSMDSGRQIDLVLTIETQIAANVDVKISTGTFQPFSEVAKTVDGIGSEDLKARNEYSITDALRSLPGFRIQQLGGFGRAASIKTRGLRNQDTAVLLDGQRLRDPSAINGDASAFISDISTVNLERVEVLRGSGSSVYGTNAIGGVLDIRTAEARTGFHGNVLGEFGGLGFTRFAGQTGFGTADRRFGFTGGFSRTGFTEGIDGSDDANNTSLRGRLDFQATDRLALSGKFFASDAFVRLNSNPDTLGVLPPTGIVNASDGVNFVPDSDDPDNFQRSDVVGGQFRGSYVLNSKTVVSAGYQGLRTQRENENGGLGPGFQPFGGIQFSFFNGQIHTLDSKIDWSLSSTGRLIAGYEYEIEKYRNKGVGPASSNDFFTRVDQRGHTVFAQFLQSFVDKKLQLAGGFRVQNFKLSTPAFSVVNAPYSGFLLQDPPIAYTYDGAASYFIESTGTKIRAHAGNGYRVPSLYERFGSFYSSFSQAFTIIGDPVLKPERSVSIDLGIDQSFYNGGLRFSATYFYTQLTDTIGYGNIVPPIGDDQRPFGGYLNTKGGMARGVELSTTINPSRSSRVFSSYTFTNSDQREPQVVGSGELRTLGVPSHRFTFAGTQRIGKDLSVNFDFEASSSYLAPVFSNSTFSTYLYRFSGNKRGDLGVRYDIKMFGDAAGLSLFGTIENLLGYSYFENGFATFGRTARTGIELRF